jgi:MscS family membrane protein
MRWSIFHLAPPLAQESAATPGRIALAVVRLLERAVEWLHAFFPEVNDAHFHKIAGLCVIALAILMRRVGARIIFSQLRRWTGKAGTGIDEHLFAESLAPVAALLMVCGIYAALTLFSLPPEAQRLVAYGTRIAVAGIFLWGVFRLGAALLDHLEKTARGRDLGVATFMPLIKRALGFLFVIFGILVIAERMGADVKTYLAGLGIGGLAFALAAQDTIANMFGSFVVVLDHPFRVGDTVRIAGNEGAVEDIGLRSTRLRTGARTLIVLPNKLVAQEAITNLSRMPQRRVDQTIGLTYDTSPEQMEAIVADLRALLKGDPGVHPGLVTVNFADYADSSLNIQIVYFTSDPDWSSHMEVRERINLKIMRAVAARGLSFAFPTQTVIHQS